ncbi:MAG: hypothetical protein ACYTFT_16115 [Planctomycetota bacterium]
MRPLFRGCALFVALVSLLAWPGAAPAQELYLDQDRYQHSEGLVEVRRPDREWVFFDLQVQRAMLEKEAPGADVSRSFQSVLCRLHHPGLKATVTVYLLPFATAEGLEPLQRAAVEHVAKQGGKLLGAGQAGFQGRTIVKVDYSVEVTELGASEAKATYVSQVDCPVRGREHRIVLILEAPLDERKAAHRALKAVLKKLRVL